MSELQGKFISNPPKSNDIVMSRKTKNHLAGLDIEIRVRTQEFIKTFPKRHQDRLSDFFETDPYRAELMVRLFNAEETA